MKIFTRFLPEAKYKTLISDKFKDKPITIFNDYIPTTEELNINPINILVINEPNEYFGHHNFALQNNKIFSLILTWSDLVLNNTDNSLLFPPAEKKLNDEYINSFQTNPERIFEISFLRGILNKTTGHNVRHKLFDAQSQITTPHIFWPVLDDFNWESMSRPGDDANGNSIWGEGKKQIWNRNSMFHVCIENTKYNNCYTEKIQDCFYTKTIPIYWGCPNLEEFWDERGVIFIENEQHAIEVINNLTPEDYYKRLPYIENNYSLALQNGCFYKRLENTLNEIIKLNNL
jgi:hypothetical protein